MPGRDARLLIETVREAGDILLGYFQNDPASWQKPDEQGPVSEADLAANEHIASRLKSDFGDIPLLSEEGEEDGRRLEAERFFILDPLDGTAAFLAGQEFFTISLAFMKGDEPDIGVIFAPALGKLYWAEAGKGAYLEDERIEISGNERVGEANILASKARYNAPLLALNPAPRLHFYPSIAYRLALVGAGEYDAAFALRPSWDWDIAAGDLICREAGGVLVDAHGEPPGYNRAIPQQQGIVAGNMALVERLIRTLQN